MNIKDATKHIKSTIEAYLQKDAYGNYVIPLEKQRPLFLYGPPGIGKTAVVEQIAEELDVGIVSYSMTHHTRQSALGLPYIKTMNFSDREYQVSEFTMSEILACVYSYIEETGKTKGILFLDEINCVSETLSPSMLRFLQYKTFGSHRVPDGWVVVTAGNPPEYNKSVREYDIATLDRIQKITVESDYSVWREYAVKREIHPAIISFLDVNRLSFYFVENTPSRKEFVTARGWEDLSRLMRSFENMKVEISQELIEQYVQVESIAADFYEYYQIFCKIQSVYCLEDILTGKENAEALAELKKANISEKIGFINYMSVCIFNVLGEAVSLNNSLKALAVILKNHGLTDEQGIDASAKLKELINEQYKLSLSKEESLYLSKMMKEISDEVISSSQDSRECVSDYLKKQIDKLKKAVSTSQETLSNSANFVFDAFGESPEFKIFVSNMTTNSKSATFLICFGCESFSKLANIQSEPKEIFDELKSVFEKT